MKHIIPATAILILALGAGMRPAAAADIETVVVETNSAGETYVADGYVEAVRQSVIAAQVSGRVTGLAVKAGDAVKIGQILVRIDERAAIQQAAAGEAQVAAAQAQLNAARKDYERSQRLHQKQYISQAAMDQSEAQFKANQAQADAVLAQARAATTETSLHTLRAPYNGIVAGVTTEVGDMALPGKPLLTVYDPSALRVIAELPENYAAAFKSGAGVKIEIPGAPENLRWQTPQSTTVLPTSDPASHTTQVRLNLPPGTGKLAPGTFVRAHLPLAGQRASIPTIPARTVIRRTELSAVYVADKKGRFQLRQVRLGRSIGDRVEVLAGLRAGERVALDPLAAARQ